MCPGEAAYQEPAGELARRIGLASDAVDALRDAYEDELEARDRLLVAAVDAGWPIREVARWARISHTRLNQVVARREAEPVAN